MRIILDITIDINKDATGLSSVFLYDHIKKYYIQYYIFNSKLYVSKFQNNSKKTLNPQTFKPRFVLFKNKISHNSETIIQTLECYGFDILPVLDIDFYEKWIIDRGIVLSKKNGFEIPDEYKAEFKLKFL